MGTRTIFVASMFALGIGVGMLIFSLANDPVVPHVELSSDISTTDTSQTSFEIKEINKKLEILDTQYSSRIRSAEKRLAMVEIENQKLRSDLEKFSQLSNGMALAVQTDQVSEDDGNSEKSKKNKPVISGQDIRMAFAAERVNDQHKRLWGAFAPDMDGDIKTRLNDMLIQHETEISTIRQNLRRASPEERKRIESEIADKESALKETISSELGNDVYAEYEAYSKSLPVRQRIEDLPLDETQREGLVKAMMDVNSNAQWNESSDRPSLRNMTSDERLAYIEKIKTVNNGYLSQSSYILTPELQTEFKENLDRQVDRLERFASGNVTPGAGWGGGGQYRGGR